MEYFFEAVLELLFGLAKIHHDEMPEIEYLDDFVVKHPFRKTLVRISSSLVIIVLFSVLWTLIKHEVRYLFAAVAFLCSLLFVLFLISFSFICTVNNECLRRSYWGLLKREIKWDDIICVRTIEQKNEKAVIIALYDRDGKCVIDFNTDMQNVWYIVKMAEHKGIEIRKEKDLTLRQISKL